MLISTFGKRYGYPWKAKASSPFNWRTLPSSDLPDSLFGSSIRACVSSWWNTNPRFLDPKIKTGSCVHAWCLSLDKWRMRCQLHLTLLSAQSPLASHLCPLENSQSGRGLLGQGVDHGLLLLAVPCGMVEMRSKLAAWNTRDPFFLRKRTDLNGSLISLSVLLQHGGTPEWSLVSRQSAEWYFLLIRFMSWLNRNRSRAW